MVNSLWWCIKVKVWNLFDETSKSVTNMTIPRVKQPKDGTVIVLHPQYIFGKYLLATVCPQIYTIQHLWNTCFLTNQQSNNLHKMSRSCTTSRLTHWKSILCFLPTDFHHKRKNITVGLFFLLLSDLTFKRAHTARG